jgi:hypothetical protein
MALLVLRVPGPQRSAFAGDKGGKRLLGLGTPDHVRRVVSFHGPLLLEAVSQVFEQQRLPP